MPSRSSPPWEGGGHVKVRELVDAMRLPGPGEGAPLLARAIDRHPGGVRVDCQPVPLGRGPGRPGPAQHDPVGGRRLGHPAEVRAGQKPPGRRHARQRVPATQRGGRRIGQQHPVGQEVPTRRAAPPPAPGSWPHRDTHPSRSGAASRSASATRFSRSSGGPHNAIPATGVRSCSERLTTGLGTDSPGRVQHGVVDTEQQTGSIHRAGALLCRKSLTSTITISRTGRALFPYRTLSRYDTAISQVLAAKSGF